MRMTGVAIGFILGTMVAVLAVDSALSEGTLEGSPAIVQRQGGEAIISGKVSEVLPDGVLLTHVSRRIDGREEVFPEGSVVFLGLMDSGELTEGQKVIYSAESVTAYRYRLESGATAYIPAYRVFVE